MLHFSIHLQAMVPDQAVQQGRDLASWASPRQLGLWLGAVPSESMLPS